jgi:glucose dehydrogenase/plastocyanin
MLTAVAVTLAVACQSGEAPPPAEADWPQPNGDYASHRARLDSEISSANVSELTLAWEFEIPGVSNFGAAATNPIVVDGVVYFQDLSSNVFAVDLETGETIWERRYDQPSIGPNGVAVGGSMVFAASSMKTVVGLDAMSGEEVWSVELATSEGEGIDIQPIAYDGLVYLSTVPENPAANGKGIIYALEQQTGSVRWSFDTVEMPDAWGNPEVNGGGGAWYPPSIDVARGMTYWGTGNPLPFPGTPEFPFGRSRPGPNLYTNSMIALNHAGGELAWYHQVTPHDLFDRDFQLSPILATIDVDGASRDLVIGAGKQGSVLAFDAESGEVLWETPVGKHQNDTVDALEPGGSVEVFPGAFGGVETPMAYADGVVFVPVVNFGTTYSHVSYKRDDFFTATGQLVALNAADGSVIWDVPFDSMVLGAATVVSDLVFTSTLAGMVYALNRETGAEVWRYQAPAGINGWPAVTNDTILIPAGLQTGDSAPVLLALRPSSKLSELPQDAASRRISPGETPPAESRAGEAADSLLELSAKDLAFDVDTIEVVAGSFVAVEFTNNDGVLHNVAFFMTPDAEEPIGAGEVFAGPGVTRTLTFKAPEQPGSYFFRCDTHPVEMTGTLIVE